MGRVAHPRPLQRHADRYLAVAVDPAVLCHPVGAAHLAVPCVHQAEAVEAAVLFRQAVVVEAVALPVALCLQMAAVEAAVLQVALWLQVVVAVVAVHQATLCLQVVMAVAAVHQAALGLRVVAAEGAVLDQALLQPPPAAAAALASGPYSLAHL